MAVESAVRGQAIARSGQLPAVRGRRSDRIGDGLRSFVISNSKRCGDYVNSCYWFGRVVDRIVFYAGYFEGFS